MKNLKLVYYVSNTDADFVQVFDMKMPTLKKITDKYVWYILSEKEIMEYIKSIQKV